MQNGAKIIVGLIVFAVLLGYPVWNNIGKKVYAKPELQMPKNGSKQCVEETEWMRAEHMVLLDEWKQSVVRDANRIYINHEGKEYLMSLQNTCMDCHSSKAEFCDKCHNSLAVSPYCWDCHIPPKEAK